MYKIIFFLYTKFNSWEKILKLYFYIFKSFLREKSRSFRHIMNYE